MTENERKTWYGSHPLTGKYSTEKYHTIKQHKNKIEKLIGKTKTYNGFSSDESKEVKNLEDEQIDIFQKCLENEKLLDRKLERKKYKSDKKISTDIQKKLYNEKFTYHSNHCSSHKTQKKIKQNEPSCTRYHPKYDLIWPKLQTGPKWSDLLGRTNKKRETDKRDFFIDKNDTKCLINMDKTTQRGEFIEAKDVRVHTVKPFINLKLAKKKNL